MSGLHRDTAEARMLRGLIVIIAALAVLVMAVIAGSVMLAGRAFGQEHQGYHSNPWLLSWIPATCCVTNNCCWEVSERELRPLPDDEWEVRSTGQVRKRTGFSPDGKFYRCACDYDNENKVWIRHQGANTRCLFVPMRSASLPPRMSGLPDMRNEKGPGARR